MRLITLIQNILLTPIKPFRNISIISFMKNCKIFKKTSIHSFTRIYNSTLSEFSYVGKNNFIESTVIGKFCSIADNCSIGLAKHPIDWVSTSPVFIRGRNKLHYHFSQHEYKSVTRTIIEDDVWIGINTIIMSGITVGKGSIVGAGSVVTKNVEPYSIVAGNPAKIIRYRFEDDIISKLLKLDWTSWTSDTISKHASLFNNVNEFVNIDVDTK